MEELQSTEILDREILEDARKKAYRILKTADDTVKAKTAEWEKKLAATLGELEEKYAQQERLAADEIMALLPMDKRRVKAEKIDSLLRHAVESWYTGLKRGDVLDLLQKELEKRVALCAEYTDSGERRVIIHKIEPAEAKAMLETILPGKSCIIKETQSAAAYPELFLETREVRICTSINKTADFFLREKRAELVEALLGKAALLDQELQDSLETGEASPC